VGEFDGVIAGLWSLVGEALVYLMLAERTLLDLFPDIGYCFNLCELSEKCAGMRKVTDQGLQALVGAGLGCVLEKLELSRE